MFQHAYLNRASMWASIASNTGSRRSSRSAQCSSGNASADALGTPASRGAEGLPVTAGAAAVVVEAAGCAGASCGVREGGGA